MVSLTTGGSLEEVFDNIVREEIAESPYIENVFLISKTGLMIAGKSRASSYSETFSAMAAVMYSSAESARSVNSKEKLDYLKVVFENTKIFIKELNAALLLVAIVNREVDDLKAINDMQKIMIRIKENFVWLR
ncbi:MAG: roadblock/LC7 domain-containing protein [Methanomassiliicoccales archaeon]